jgi:hypothetical protein
LSVDCVSAICDVSLRRWPCIALSTMTKQTQHDVHRQATGHITSAQRAASFEHARAEPATRSKRGHERSRSGVDSAGPNRSSSSSAHQSLRLIEAASALDDAQRAALSASLAAHRARLAGTTHDLTGPGALDRKIDALRTLSAHLAAIQANVSVNQNALHTCAFLFLPRSLSCHPLATCS